MGHLYHLFISLSAVLLLSCKQLLDLVAFSSRMSGCGTESSVCSGFLLIADYLAAPSTSEVLSVWGDPYGTGTFSSTCGLELLPAGVWPRLDLGSWRISECEYCH